MKKTIKYSGIALLLILGVWLYSVGYIPVIGNIISTEKINSYAKEVYKTQEKIKVGYNFYNMGAYNSDGYLYSINSNRIIDLNLYENNGEETTYKQDYQKIIDTFENGVHFEDYYIACSVDANDYSSKYYQLVVYNISNDNILTESESLEKPAEIVMKFVESMPVKYNFTSVNVSYKDNNGTKQILFSGDIPISKELLIKNTVNSI